MRNEVLHRAKEERNSLKNSIRRKANWIGHMLRRNCLLKDDIEGKIEAKLEVTGRRGRSYWMILRKREGPGN